MHAGRRRDIGLGSWPAVTLAQARSKAIDTRRAVKEGKPVASRPVTGQRTLGDAVEDFVRATAPSWRSRTEETHTRNQLKCWWGHLYGRSVAGITQDDLLPVFEKVWRSPAVATRLLSRTRRVFQREAVLRHIDRSPVEWDGIRLILPRPVHRQRNHPAVEAADAPAAYARLKAMTGLSALALRLAVLTGVRSGEARGMEWSEISGDRWVIPEPRMKNGSSHTVPLVPEVLNLIASVPRVHPVYVFPGATGRPLTDMALLKVMRQLDDTATVHGWRSTARQFWAEHQVDPVLAELNLAHRQGSAVERAYQRSDLVELRRPSMVLWSEHLTRGT